MLGNDAPKIAVAQYAPHHADPEQNLELSLQQIRRAREGAADLVVLPELCLTGIIFEERAKLYSLAETQQGPACTAWLQEAADLGIHIVAGLAERSGERLYNSAVHVRPDGALACYRKSHFFGGERALFDHGSSLVVSGTPWGKLGMAVCYDLWFPEVMRALALGGASLIAVPANWFTPPRQAGEDMAVTLPMGVHLAIAAACSNEVTIACASRIGAEGGVTFLGRSVIVGPNGRAAAGPASHDQAEILQAAWCDPQSVRVLGQSHLETRRPDLYASVSHENGEGNPNG